MEIKDISLRLSKLRDEKGVSARDMSLSIGQNENYINRIENDISLPSLRGLILICEYFGITLKEFFDVENKSPNDLNEFMEEIKTLDVDTLKHLIEFVRGIRKQK